LNRCDGLTPAGAGWGEIREFRQFPRNDQPKLFEPLINADWMLIFSGILTTDLSNADFRMQNVKFQPLMERNR